MGDIKKAFAYGSLEFQEEIKAKNINVAYWSVDGIGAMCLDKVMQKACGSQETKPSGSPARGVWILETKLTQLANKEKTIPQTRGRVFPGTVGWASESAMLREQEAQKQKNVQQGLGNTEVVVYHMEAGSMKWWKQKPGQREMGEVKKYRQHLDGILPRNLAMMKAVKKLHFPMCCERTKH